jgi:hypothetical protein
MRQLANRSSLISVALSFGVLCSGAVVRAQSSGTIFGTLDTPGSRDSHWTIAALPSGFTPPDSQTTPYAAYVPTNVDGAFLGGGNPQTGYSYGGDTIYWIAPQNSTNSLVGGTYNWIAQQQFTVPTTGFYRFDFPGAGDNELEFYIGGAINTTDPLRPTITGGQQIGNRAGTFTAISTFTGGAQLSAGTYTASMVLWDYGGSTGAMIGTSTFGPAVAYWAPATGAGGNGTWNNANVFWAPAADGSGTKGDWTQAVGVAYFGGTAGTVSVGENLAVNQMYFTTGGYVVQDNALSMGSGGTITSQSGLATISSTLNPSTNLKIAGSGTVALAGTTNIGFGRELIVDGGNLLVNGVVTVPAANGSVNVSSGSLGGTGSIGGSIRGGGRLDPGPTGGNAGILATVQLNPSDGLDVNFVFNAATPDYTNASDSDNDVLRITANPAFTAPFTSALASTNRVNVFFNDITATTAEELQALTGESWSGGFFTDTSNEFLASVRGAQYLYYIYGDGNGTRTFNGVNYYYLRDIDPEWTRNFFVGTEAESADFGGGVVNGRVTTFTVAVPEPSTVALAAVAGLAALRRRRRA